MSDLYKTMEKDDKTEALKNELVLKQMQINFLMNLTMAINNNVSAAGLFKMYRLFLNWEMGIKKLALYIKEYENWICATSIGISKDKLELDISEILPQYKQLQLLKDEKHELLGEFDVVVPVKHKELFLAYIFVGDFEGTADDQYDRIRFITTITNVIAVAIENKRLFKKQIEQEQFRQELKLAIEMQKTLIPKTLPKSKSFELASIYRPQLGVGGDYFDYIQVDDKEFAFCIADISGKGMSAALLMANFQANFHRSYSKDIDLDEFIRELNKRVYQVTQGNKFITFFIARYNFLTKKLCYVNAGHPAPFLLKNKEISTLDKGCTFLGSFIDLPEVEVGSMLIDRQTLIFSYTDGFSDLINEEGKFIDEKSIYDFILNFGHLPPNKFNSKLLKTIEKFIGKRSYPDDLTVLTCKIGS